MLNDMLDAEWMLDVDWNAKRAPDGAHGARGACESRGHKCWMTCLMLNDCLMWIETLNAPWTEHMELEVPVKLEGTDAEWYAWCWMIAWCGLKRWTCPGAHGAVSTACEVQGTHAECWMLHQTLCSHLTQIHGDQISIVICVFHVSVCIPCVCVYSMFVYSMRMCVCVCPWDCYTRRSQAWMARGTHVCVCVCVCAYALRNASLCYIR